MSGIAGIVNLDGAPVDRRILARMTRFLTFRGPDEQRLWTNGAAGFGHTLLRTTDESEREYQPLTLDGHAWIVADARVDARRDLIAELGARGHNVAVDVPDVELILHSYCVWQEDCLDHLLGDFAFAIWDAPRRRLFCARDHMGVKPLYYAWLGSCIVFSNSLDCLRQHPGVSDRLNDLAIADFLLFDLNQEKATTTFADIQRIPPAHSATWSASGVQMRRYWTLPIDKPIYYRRPDDYVDHFQELLRTAVGDRLRTDRVGIFMSGGIDSPTLAATACNLLRDRSGHSGVSAFTTSYNGYDEERYFAGLVAENLGIPIEFQGWSADMAPLDWCGTHFHVPEPTPYPNYLAAGRAYHRRIASHSRVAFYGEGPDNALLYEWQPYLSYLVRDQRFGQLLHDLCWHAALHRSVPLPTFSVVVKRRQPNVRKGPFFPDWFNLDFEKRIHLRARWEQLRVAPPSPHVVRPASYRSFDRPIWQAIFEGFDAAHTRSLLEVRHPFMDLRLLRYLLAVPAVPWCRSKYLFRRAMHGLLPQPVLRRPKSPLVHNPWADRVRERGLPPLVPAPRLKQYVDTGRLSRTPAGNVERFWIDFRTRSLNYWLQNLYVPHNDEEDFPNESIGQTIGQTAKVV